MVHVSFFRVFISDNKLRSEVGLTCEILKPLSPNSLSVDIPHSRNTGARRDFGTQKQIFLRGNFTLFFVAKLGLFYVIFVDNVF